MAVKIWMCENFDHSHERDTISYLIDETRKHFEDDENQTFHIVCNVKLRNSFENYSSTIDAVIIKEDAIVIVEMKSVSSAISGGDTEPWQTASGVILKGGTETRNPYWQVRDYRNVISNRMRAKQSAFINSKTKKLDWWIFVKGMVMLDPNLVEGSDLIQIKNHSPWFRCVRKKEAIKTILNFTTSKRTLTQDQMEKLITNVFKANEARVIDNAICLPKKELVKAKTIPKPFVGAKKIKEETLHLLTRLTSASSDNVLEEPPPMLVNHMSVRVFDCKTDSLPAPLKKIATHEYLVCVKVTDGVVDADMFTAQVENLLNLQISVEHKSVDCFFAFWPDGQLLAQSQGDLFIDEIGTIHFSDLGLSAKYSRLWDVLDRMTKSVASEYETQFTNFFSRLQYVCSVKEIEFHHLNQFRIRANKLRNQQDLPLTETDYLEDLLSLYEITCKLFLVERSAGLEEVLSTVTHTPISEFVYKDENKSIRIIVEHWDNHFIYGHVDDDKFLTQIDYKKTRYGHSSAFSEINRILFKGAELNLLTPFWDNKRKCYNPSQIVFMPDYLISTTELAGCVTQFTSDPLSFIIKKLQADDPSPAMMMGNFANQFFYDLMTQSGDSDYTNSQNTFYYENALDLSALDLDTDWFQESHIQYKNIKHCITNILPEEHQFDLTKAIVEASFVSASMGIQGRMDCLYLGPNQGEARVLELKSGKWDTFRGNRPQIAHNAQAALYRDILYHLSNLKREHVKSILFYSKTIPEGNFNDHMDGMVFADAPTAEEINNLVQLRNRIVGAECFFMHNDGAEFFDAQTPDSLLLPEKQAEASDSRFWNEYIKPPIEQVLGTIQNASPLAKSYFFRFLSFLIREKFLTKVGDEKIGSSQGVAASWNTSVATKLANGTVLIDLKVKELFDKNGVEKVTFLINAKKELGSVLNSIEDDPDIDMEAIPNFRKGDSVLFYPRNDSSDNITNHIIVEGDIENLSTTEVTIQLKNKQRTAFFDKTGFYALEHGIHSSSSEFKSLFCFLAGLERRQNLILNRMKPRINQHKVLFNENLKKKNDEELKRIVLEAKQAEDYYLLIGPPGTGKTSHAIRWMIEEFLTDPETMILLVAYTNRAVDEICEMLDKVQSKPTYLRIGRRLTCADKFQTHLEDVFFKDCPNRQTVQNKLNTTRIVVGTLTSLSGKTSLFKLKHFDIAIIDEASQILEPQLLRLFCGQNNNRPFIDKFILVGDHKQLPAVVQQTVEESSVQDESLRNIGLLNCRNSLFERLYRLNKSSDGIIGQLSTQWRMHPTIADFSNSRFYDGKLKVGEAEHQQKEHCYEKYNPANELECFVATHRLGFVPSREPSIGDSHKINRHEASVVARLVECVYNLYEINGRPFEENSLGIIVPFRNQIAMIRREIYKLAIPEKIKELISNGADTVERYQGGQRDVIIFSTTINQPYQKAILSVVGDDEDGETPVDRKLNVAITRPREQLFVTGNEDLLREIPVYDDLIDWLIEKGGALNLE